MISPLLLLGGLQCRGCEDDRVRLIRMEKDTALYLEATRESERLGVIPAGQLAERRGEPVDSAEESMKWYPVLWKGKEGYVLLDSRSLAMNTVSPEEKENQEGAEATEDLVGEGDIGFEPKRLKPARFDPAGKTFSLGLGCTGSTHSEYSVTLEFKSDEIRMIDSGLMEYGMPGEACGSTYQDILVGTYELEDGQVRASFNRKIHRLHTATFPNCDATQVEEKTETVERKDRFFMLECDGKKALQLDPTSVDEAQNDPEASSFDNQYFVIQ